MTEKKFDFKVAVDDSKLEQLHKRIEQAADEIERKYGDVVEQERQKTGKLLNYGETPIDDISYDHWKAQQHRFMFPEGDDPGGGIKGLVRRFYRKVVRRLLRQQLVFNQSVVGTLDDMHQRLRTIEKKLDIISDKKDN